jgi:hypothetical protein
LKEAARVLSKETSLAPWQTAPLRRSPFRYFKANPEIIRLAVMLYIRFPLSLRNVEDPQRENWPDVSLQIDGCDGLDFSGVPSRQPQGNTWFRWAY